MTDTQLKAKQYAQAALELLDEADREFARCNIGLTSEKLWEAAASAVKSVCVYRGWQHVDYEHLSDAIKCLKKETEDDSLYTGFRIAYNGQLFVGSLEEDEVETDIPIVRRLVSKLLTAVGQPCNESD